MSPLRSETLAVRGLVLVEHELDVPLDHAEPTGPALTVFAREVADPDGRDRPFLVYLQGGPGQEAPRPTRQPTSPRWLDRALRDFRVLMLDQRGTGRSTPFGVTSAADAAAAGRPPRALPRRRDRRATASASRGTRRRPLERARPVASAGSAR